MKNIARKIVTAFAASAVALGLGLISAPAAQADDTSWEYSNARDTSWEY